MTRYSLAEIDAQGRKAARGAGYPWGLAEEAGRAVRWLEARGLPGCAALARLLAAQDGCDYDVLRPNALGGVWEADDGALCPLIVGVTLADHCFDVPPTLGKIREPLLLLPYLAACRLTHPGITAEAGVHDLSSAPLAPAYDDRRATPASREIEPEIWSALDRFAHRTYVPATDASRAGAGAGTTDND